jgi:Zn-dependent peptidase ImmA (M78 family)
MGAKFALDRSQDSELLGAELHNALTGAGVIWSNRQSETFLRLLVAGAERLGVVVIQTQRVDLAAMRGFSLADGPCPIIALNGSDAPRGKTFTLLHELAHVGFRADGLCDLAHDVVSDIERLCDRVAAAALMPKQEFLMAASSLRGGSLIVENVGALGDSFGVSGEAALIRLIELGHASWTDYHRLKPEFEAKYRAYRERMQHEQQEKSAKIGFSLKVRDLGRSYIRAVLRAHGDDLISSGEVTSLLGTGYGELAKFAQAAGGDTW